jgi:hypothetical protein
LDDAEDQFRVAAAEDYTCAMAYWAETIGLYRPLAYRPSDADMKAGWALIQKAKTLAPKTQRERDYVEAAAVLYRPDGRAFSERNHQYSAAVERVYKDYPSDREGSVFYALSLLTWADSEHPITDSEKAIAILKPLFRENPDHPGLAHYLIHAADSPQLAQAGLEAARRYAQIAPASPHALHMPSHIFARLGLWQEDIRSNLASLDAAQNSSSGHVDAENTAPRPSAARAFGIIISPTIAKFGWPPARARGGTAPSYATQRATGARASDPELKSGPQRLLANNRHCTSDESKTKRPKLFRVMGR